MNTIMTDIKKLSISERIHLVEDIWNSIADEPPFSLELSAQEQDELRWTPLSRPRLVKN